MPTYSNAGDRAYILGNPPRTLAPGADGFATPLILDHLDGLVRTADTPRYNLLRDRTDLIFTAAGQQTVSFTAPHLIKAILITSSVAIDVFINAADNSPGKRILADHEYFMTPNGCIEALVITATAAGIVVIEVVGPQNDDETNNSDGVTFGGESVTFGGDGVTWGGV